MIYEYAISPVLCTNYQDLRFLLETFGKAEGRLFADIPRKKWIRLTRKEIKGSVNGQVMKKRLVVGVDKLVRKAIYHRNFVPQPNSDIWIDHALVAHDDRPFQAILTDYYDGDETCILRYDHEFTEDCRWKVPLDKTIRRSAANIIEAIRPMLDCAREVILIDRNFNPEIYRWRPFLLELSDFLSKRRFSPSINKIDFHLGDDIAADHMEFLCNKYLSKERPSDFKMNFIIWPRDALHDRYIITDIGGVNFGIGLDIWDGSGPEEVKINRISEETRIRLWKACKSKQISFSIQ